MKLFKTILVFVFLAFTGCGSSPLFNVKSDPLQADVFFIPNDHTEKKSLGKTPLSLPMEELKKTVKAVESGEFFTVSVEKEGFLSQTFVIPATQFGTSVTQLDVKMKQGQIAEEKKQAKDILDQIFLAQKFALSLQFERAQIELDKILTPFPDFANALSMRAAIFYAQKNYTESIKWYEKAIKADPKMDEAVKMLAKIKTLQNGGGANNSERQPASKNKKEIKK